MYGALLAARIAGNNRVHIAGALTFGVDLARAGAVITTGESVVVYCALRRFLAGEHRVEPTV